MLSVAVTLAVALLLIGTFDQGVLVSRRQGEFFRRLGMEPF